MPLKITSDPKLVSLKKYELRYYPKYLKKDSVTFCPES